MYFSPVSPSILISAFQQISLERGHLLRETKRDMRGRKDVCTLTEPLDFPKAFPAKAFLSTGTFVTAGLQLFFNMISSLLSKGHNIPCHLGLAE